MSDIEHRLATYGTLAPGRPNHHQLDGLVGTWSKGTVHGRLLESGWGAAMGFPGMVLDSDGPAIEIHLFESADLPAHWARLDHFECPGYCRSEVAVEPTTAPLWRIFICWLRDSRHRSRVNAMIGG